MADRIVEGIWDCPYCEAKAIGGLRKYCPNCGHPQDKGTKFRVGEEKRYLTEEEKETHGKGPDWSCGYCDALNNSTFKFCASCGAKREADDKDYFQLREAERLKEQKKQETKQAAPPPKKNRFLLLAVIIGLVLLAFNMCSAKDYGGTITAKAWERNIEIEQLTTVEESDWNIPSGGRELYTKREIRTYNQVFDHYETRTRQVPYQVEDGYDTSYTDNGDGTFTEHQTPRYRTEYRTEEYEEAVYRDEPVYDTKHYYEIDKWVHKRDVSTSGAADEPYWGETKLAKAKSDNGVGAEREGNKTEMFQLTISVSKKKNKSKEYNYECDLSTWSKYKVNQKIEVTLQSGKVKAIE